MSPPKDIHHAKHLAARTFLKLFVQKKDCIQGAVGIYFAAIHIVGKFELHALVV